MRQQAWCGWRWAIPFYIIPIPFAGLVVYSAWQVLQGAGAQVALITLGHNHLESTLIWGSVSILSFGVAWRLDQRYLSADETPVQSLPAPLPPFEAIEEPTMILHAQAIEANPTPDPSTDGEESDSSVSSLPPSVNSDH